MWFIESPLSGTIWSATINTRIGSHRQAVAESVTVCQKQRNHRKAKSKINFNEPSVIVLLTQPWSNRSVQLFSLLSRLFLFLVCIRFWPHVDHRIESYCVFYLCPRLKVHQLLLLLILLDQLLASYCRPTPGDVHLGGGYHPSAAPTSNPRNQHNQQQQSASTIPIGRAINLTRFLCAHNWWNLPFNIYHFNCIESKSYRERDLSLNANPPFAVSGH